MRSHALAQQGLRSHLDRTKGKHNDHGYDYFLRCLEFKTPIKTIAERFNVEPPTIYSWLRQHETEKNST